MESLRIDIVGAGRFSHVLANTIRDSRRLSLGGVCDTRPESAQEMARTFGMVAYTCLEDMLEKSRSGSVLVVTPHSTHRDIVVAAARAGRHIFCEKAMARTVAECHEMIDAAHANHVKLMIGHKRRFRPQFDYMKQILLRGELGRPMVGNVLGFHWPMSRGAPFHGEPEWWNRRRDVGGLLHKNGVHDVDNLRFFFGEVQSVFAVEGPKVHNETDLADGISVLLHFRNGMIVTMEVCPYFPLLTYRRSFSYQFTFENGGLLYDPTRLAVEHQIGDGGRTVKVFDDFGYETAFARELDSFAQWVLHDVPPEVTAEDGMRCVEIMQAAYLSAARGQKIALPLDRTETGP